MANTVFYVYHSHIWNPEFLTDCIKISRWDAPSLDMHVKVVMLKTRADAEKYCMIVERYGGKFFKPKRVDGKISYVPIDKTSDRIDDKSEDENDDNRYE